MPLPVLSIRCTFLTPEPPARSLSSTRPPRFKFDVYPPPSIPISLWQKSPWPCPLAAPHRTSIFHTAA